MKKLTIIIICILNYGLTIAQNNSKIDSLLDVLNKSKELDTNRVNTLNSLSKELIEIAQYDSAHRICEEALVLSQKIQYPKGIGNVYSHFGSIYYFQENYIEALTYHEKALKISRQLDVKKYLARDYNNIGNCYNFLDNYPEALKNYLISLKIQEELHDTLQIANLLSNISEIYCAIGNYNEAFNNVFAALNIYKELNNQSNIGICYANIAQIYDGQRKLPEALINYFLALKVYENIHDKEGIAWIFGEIGINYDNQGKKTEALKYYEEALLMYREIGDKSGLSRNLLNISILYYDLNKTAISRKYLNEAFKLALEINSPPMFLAHCYGQSANLDSATGDFKSAYANLQMYFKIKDSVFNMEKEKKITQLALQYEFDKKEAETKNEQDKKDVIHASILADTKKNRNIIIGGMIAAFLFTGTFFYNRSRHKKLLMLKQVSEVEMKALRAQMNPHFIFNSLNSIYSYIQINDYEMASDYLIRFSKLIRLTLQNSMNPLITLQDELEVLNLYLSLESDRLKKRFRYSIHVNDEIEQASVLIPPLMFQPYIENAIWHGMQNKVQDGMIEINITKEGEMLHCTITDNGSGMKLTSDGKKKSYGTSITEQRLKVLNQLSHTKGYVTIKNIKEEDSDKTGVRVGLVIPVERA